MSHFLSRLPAVAGASSSRLRDSLPSCPLTPRPSPLAPHFGGEEKSNRDNPTFKNRHNSMTTNQKTFSNRNKNALSGSPDFCPHDSAGFALPRGSSQAAAATKALQQSPGIDNQRRVGDNSRRERATAAPEGIE
jgi:hypothetical protein